MAKAEKMHRRKKKKGYVSKTKCPKCGTDAVWIKLIYRDEKQRKRNPYCRKCEIVIGRDIHIPMAVLKGLALPSHWLKKEESDD